MTCYLALLRSCLGFIGTGQLQRLAEENFIFLQFYFCRAAKCEDQFPRILCLVANVALYAAAALQVHVNCSTPMFQHSAEPSKTFLHTKIYLSSKSLLSSCCSFHKGHTLSQSPPLHLPYLLSVWLTLLSCHSGHWWCPSHMSRSHWLSLSLSTVSVFPLLAQRWYLPARVSR